MSCILGALVVFVALLAALPAAGAEARNPRPYAGFSGFLATLEDDEVVAAGGSLRLEHDDGFGFAAALGAAAPTGGRVEIEAAFRTNDLARICAPACADVDGRTESLSLLVNALYDLPLGIPLRPYLGVGAGAALVSFDSAAVPADGDDVVFAYQFLAGLGWQVSRTLTLVGGYRYFATTDATVDGLDVDYRSHNIEAGVRIGF